MPDHIDYDVELTSPADLILQGIVQMEDQVFPVIIHQIATMSPEKAHQLLITTTIPFLRVQFAAASLAGVLEGALSSGEDSLDWEDIGPLVRALAQRVEEAQTIDLQKVPEDSGEEAPSDEAPTKTER